MSEARDVAVDHRALAADRYVALWSLLTEAPEDNLDVAAVVAEEPVGEVEAWAVPLQAVALVALVPRDPGRWMQRFEEVARSAPGTWIFDALAGVSPSYARPLMESLAATGTAHVAHPALSRLLAEPWEGRGRWALRALRDPDRDVQAIALEVALRFDEPEVTAIAPMLEDPSADARLVAAEALANIPSDAARDTLQKRLASERSARVRRLILETPGVNALPEKGPEAAPEGGPAALVQRARATVDALAKPVAPWFTQRPELHWEDGSVAPWVVGEYVLFCQHLRAGADLDERALESAAMLDRASLSQWSVAMLEAWIARRADVKHHWCLSLAVALGGDLVVPVVQREIAHWHRGGRRALADQAARLLAYVGGDAAVRALDEIARAHGYDALGSLASSALEAEAGARGVTREALSDAVVPRWGLNAEGKGWLDYGRRRFRVWLEAGEGQLLEATLIDRDWRVLSAPPKPTRGDDPMRAHEALLRWKALRSELPATLAAETARFEEALCTGRAWPLAVWRERVMGHPVLRALAERFVWRVASPGHRAVFAKPTKGELTGERGEPLRVRPDATLSLAHPVALADDARERWASTLAAAGIVKQPFPQLSRAVFRVTREEARETSWRALEGKALKAPSDRTRARPPPWIRAGWSPAPLENGVCRLFLRRYGAVEAAFEVDGIALWSETARESPARALRFRHAHGDGAWLALGDVAASIVSEAVRAAAHAIDGGEDPDRGAAADASGAKKRPPRATR